METDGLSPVVLPELSIREGENVILRRPLRMPSLATLEITLLPETDSEGRPWSVELTEAAAVFPRLNPVSRLVRVGDDGRGRADRLRADAYEIVVRNSEGATVHRTSVDLYGGGVIMRTLDIRAIAVRGKLRAGEDPLKADLQFSTASGDLVKVLTDDDGRFEALFPRPGTWNTTVFHPPGSTAARIKGPDVRVVDEESSNGHEVDIRIPGGRLTGIVVDPTGKSSKAAVHVIKHGRMIAQQVTKDDGRFDLVGVEEGSLDIDAQTETGTTPKAVTVTMEKDATREVRLTTRPYSVVSGYVMTPRGMPASGAVIKVSPDGGTSWTHTIADVEGFFRYYVGSETQNVALIILTYMYPAAIRTVTVGEPRRIVLPQVGGLLRLGAKPSGVISSRGVTAPWQVFLFPQPMRFDGNFYVESGLYTLCDSISSPLDQCRTLDVRPGTDPVPNEQHAHVGDGN